MTIRFRAASAASMALVLGLSVAAAGCGKYSWSTLSAVKSFKDANLLYAQKDWKRASEKYEEVVARPDAIDKYPQLATAYFFLGNSYDQLYKPAKQGDANNDAYIQKAIANYRLASQKNTDVAWARLQQFQSPYYISIDYGNRSNPLPEAQRSLVIPSDPFNVVNTAIFQRVKASGSYRVVPGTRKIGAVVLHAAKAGG